MEQDLYFLFFKSSLFVGVKHAQAQYKLYSVSAPLILMSREEINNACNYLYPLKLFPHAFLCLYAIVEAVSPSQLKVLNDVILLWKQ